MFTPDEALEQLPLSHARLFERLTGLTDQQVKQPSRLPGWSIGHVLTHLSRNADSVVRRLEGAVRDEIVDQYPGGAPGRRDEIEAGAGRGAGEQIADLRATALRVEEVAATVPAAAWQRLSRGVGGSLSPASGVLNSRIREVEVHHVDLGLGYQPQDWPARLVQDELARELPRLAGRTDPAGLLGWLTGRGPAPELRAWR